MLKSWGDNWSSSADKTLEMRLWAMSKRINGPLSLSIALVNVSTPVSEQGNIVLLMAANECPKNVKRPASLSWMVVNKKRMEIFRWAYNQMSHCHRLTLNYVPATLVNVTQACCFFCFYFYKCFPAVPWKVWSRFHNVFLFFFLTKGKAHNVFYETSCKIEV